MPPASTSAALTPVRAGERPSVNRQLESRDHAPRRGCSVPKALVPPDAQAESRAIVRFAGLRAERDAIGAAAIARSLRKGV